METEKPRVFPQQSGPIRSVTVHPPKPHLEYVLDSVALSLPALRSGSTPHVELERIKQSLLPRQERLDQLTEEARRIVGLVPEDEGKRLRALLQCFPVMKRGETDNG